MSRRTARRGAPLFGVAFASDAAPELDLGWCKSIGWCVIVDEAEQLASSNQEPPFVAIEAYPPIIDDAVYRMRKATGRPRLIVAHSMGDVAVREWLSAKDASPRLNPRSARTRFRESAA